MNSQRFSPFLFSSDLEMKLEGWQRQGQNTDSETPVLVAKHWVSVARKAVQGLKTGSPFIPDDEYVFQMGTIASRPSEPGVVAMLAIRRDCAGVRRRGAVLQSVCRRSRSARTLQNADNSSLPLIREEMPR